MLSKESMVTVPVVVALFDRVFLYDTWREAWAKRRPLYLGLALGWVVLGFVLWTVPRTSVGFGTSVSAWTYLLNQLQIIPRYLGLAVWPQSLVLDYGVPRALTFRDVALPGLLVVGLGLVTVVALWVRPLVGFLGAWVFITLAPTSSIVPIATEVGAERRMYLPMAAIVVALVLLLRAAVGRFRTSQRGAMVLVAVTAMLCVLLGARTALRNREYQSRRAIAQSIVDRYPNGRGHFLLAEELVKAGEHEPALAQLRLAVVDFPPAHFALATELVAGGRTAEAIKEAEAFIRLVPESPVIGAAYDLLGQALVLEGQLDSAAEQFTLLTHVRADDPAPYMRLANIRLRQRRFDEAIAYYQSALAKRPTDGEIFKQLGLALSAAGRRDEAIDAFGRGVELRPTDLALLNFLGRALGAQGRYGDAVLPMRRIADLAPTDRQARENVRVMEQLAARAGQTVPVPPSSEPAAPPVGPVAVPPAVLATP
jgi:tetratricopeptide (TPR) repeat protein